MGKGRGRQPSSPLWPTRIVENYGAHALHINGPVIPARWAPPEVLVDKILTTGRQPPPPVPGLVLLDTGASSTCISLKAAAALHLDATRMAVAYGATGEHQNPVFFARLEISIPGKATSSLISMEREVQGLPDLEKPFEITGLQRDGETMEMVGLLGRDVLRKTRFKYDGVAGKLVLRFDASLLHIPDRS